MNNWGDTINSKIEDARTSMKKHIDDDRPPLQPNNTNPLTPFKSPILNKALDFYFHNPIAAAIQKYNPATMLLSAIEGGIEDALADSDYALDTNGKSVWTKLIKIISDFFVQEGDNFMRLMTEIADRCGAVMADFSRVGQEIKSLLGDAFWTMFDAIKILIVQLWKLLTALIEAIMDLMVQEMKIPLIADLWEDFAEQPFTLWNVTSYVFALMLNIISLSTTNKLPFEAWGDPRTSMRQLVSNTRARSNVTASTAHSVAAPQAVPQIKAMQDNMHVADVTANDETRRKQGQDQWQTWSDLTSLVMNGATFISGLMGALQLANKSGDEAANAQQQRDVDADIRNRIDSNVPRESTPLMAKKATYDASALTNSWTYLFQNIQFVCDAFQITAQVTAIAAYADIGYNNSAFKNAQSPSFGVQASVEPTVSMVAWTLTLLSRRSKVYSYSQRSWTAVPAVSALSLTATRPLPHLPVRPASSCVRSGRLPKDSPRGNSTAFAI